MKKVFIAILILAVLVIAGIFIFMPKQKALTPVSSAPTISANAISSNQPAASTNAVSLNQSAVNQPTVSQPAVNQPAASPSEKTFTLADIASHNSSSDCYMAIHGKVYDVTKGISTHPGGASILLGCGKDATSLFENRPGINSPHPQKARDDLAKYLIGTLAT